jgi:hypothetical protein
VAGGDEGEIGFGATGNCRRNFWHPSHQQHDVIPAKAGIKTGFPFVKPGGSRRSAHETRGEAFNACALSCGDVGGWAWVESSALSP